MGTNFHLHLPDGDDLHIGKRSGAGGGLCSFALEAHRTGPLDSRIVTWSQWVALIRLACQQGGAIHDEYNAEHDPEVFIAEVESTTTTNRRRQYDWMRDHGYPVLPEGELPDQDYGGDWLCPSNFSITFKEFS